MDRKKQISIALPLAVVLVVALFAFGERSKAGVYQHDSGFIFGTSYNITYEAPESHKDDFVKVLNGVDMSLSPFNENSIITAVNKNDSHRTDSHFDEVYNLAHEVYQNTGGAFDITVAPLVNIWGFGFKSGKEPTKKDIDSIRAFVGFDKISLENGHVKKQDPRTMLDCSAIAKGYGVDMIAKYMHVKGIENYMIEIGGEVIVKGKNSSGKPWKIGVTKPVDDSLATKNELQTILSLSDIAMATSGNYRNFYYKGGKKYAHTIDPKTGYPVQHNILSATVLANTCAKADAYATAFMVLGLEKAKEVLTRQSDLKAYFIYTDENGKNAVWFSPELEKDIAK